MQRIVAVPAKNAAELWSVDEKTATDQGLWPYLEYVTVESSQGGTFVLISNLNHVVKLNCFTKSTIEPSTSNCWLAGHMIIRDWIYVGRRFREKLVSLKAILKFRRKNDFYKHCTFLNLQRYFYECLLSARLFVQLKDVYVFIIMFLKCLMRRQCWRLLPSDIKKVAFSTED